METTAMTAVVPNNRTHYTLRLMKWLVLTVPACMAKRCLAIAHLQGREINCDAYPYGISPIAPAPRNKRGEGLPPLTLKTAPTPSPNPGYESPSLEKGDTLRSKGGFA